MTLTRLSDALTPSCASPGNLPPLPVIDWSKIGATTPKHIDLGKPGKDTPLPKADIVVMTWTATEWNALDHVFVSSDSEAHVTSHSFRSGWYWRSNDKYIKGAYYLWGFYRMVEITNAAGEALRVLLWKSDAHLAHPPWAGGLMQMVREVINEADPQRVYTIGTAGGATVNEKLGDTAITNAGTIRIKKPENKDADLNDKSVACTSWFPAMDLNDKLQDNLLFKLSNVVTDEYLEYLLCKAIHDPKDGNTDWAGHYTVADFKNAAIEGLNAPKGLNKKDVPLLTTDYYFISDGTDTDQYSALEMDDSVIGYVAGEMGRDYVFVRNISDPIVPTKTQSGGDIPTALREAWSGQIYQHYGFYSSMNGALLTWGTIAADKDLKARS
ncbi:hypothetical protein GN278_08815 [Rhodobacteraceae bacterium Araon29]